MTAPPTTVDCKLDVTGAVSIASSALLGCGFRDEITQAIIFYNGRGWNWLPLVSYLIAKANGEWPLCIKRKAKI